MDGIHYSRGTHRTTRTVEQRIAADEDTFIDQILDDVASAKYKQFFCAPVRKGTHPRAAKEPEKYSGEQHWRVRDHVEPWRVARFDCDAFDSPRTFDALKTCLAKFKGFLYTTTNHTEASPRCRFVVLLNAEVNRDEGKRVCEGIAAEIDACLQAQADDDLVGDWQPVIGWDTSVYLAEQQCYMPVVDLTGNLKTKTGEVVTPALTSRFHGELADVAYYLARVPADEKSARRRRRTDAGVAEADSDPADSEYWSQWEGIDAHTMDDLRSALSSPGMLRISAGGRNDWQTVIAQLSYLKDTPYEGAARDMAQAWSEAGGDVYDADAFEEVWDTSSADLTSYKGVFLKAQQLGWKNPQTLRPFLRLEKTGCYMTDDGLMENVEKGKKVVAHKVSAPFTVLGRTRNPDGNGWGRLLAFRNEYGEVRHCVVADHALHKQSSDVPLLLISLGLWVAYGLHRPMLAYINSAPAKKRITCVALTGWHDGKVFVLPDRTTGPDAGATVYQNSGRDTSQMAQAGTPEEWRTHIAAKCEGNSRLVFSVCVALAAPLMEIAGMDGGVFSLLGASTKGKSTAQHVAASVWGKGTTSGGYVRSWNTTQVGLEVMASVHNDLPLILDELKSVSAKMVGSSAYTLAMGRGKERGTKDIALREVPQWRTLVLASSEKPFDSFLKAAGETVEAGQQARFVDVPAIVSDTTGLFDTLHGLPHTTEHAKHFADALNRDAATRYGTAGIAWLEYLTGKTRAALQTRMTQLCDTFRGVYRPAETGAQLDRVMERFTLCAVAGELATEAGITSWPKGEAFNGVGACFKAYTEARGTLLDMEGANGVAYLRQYLSDNGQANFMRTSSDKVRVHDGYLEALYDEPVTGEAGSLADESGPVDECYWIFAEALARILENHNLKATLTDLEATGALIVKDPTRYEVTNESRRLLPSGKMANPKLKDPVHNAQRRYYRILSSKLFS